MLIAYASAFIQITSYAISIAPPHPPDNFSFMVPFVSNPKPLISTPSQEYAQSFSYMKTMYKKQDIKSNFCLETEDCFVANFEVLRNSQHANKFFFIWKQIFLSSLLLYFALLCYN